MDWVSDKIGITARTLVFFLSSTIILVAALFIIMTGMGLSLTMADFKRVLQFPKAVFIGFLSQIILLPVIGYILI